MSSQASLYKEVRRIRVIERDVVMEGEERREERGERREERGERREREREVLALCQHLPASTSSLTPDPLPCRQRLPAQAKLAKVTHRLPYPFSSGHASFRAHPSLHT